MTLAALIVDRFLAADAPVTVAVDDTLLHRWGRKVYGCFYHHDATANSQRSAVAWATTGWSSDLRHAAVLAADLCLPVLFRLWQPRRPEYAKVDRPDPQRPGKPAMTQEMIDLLAARLPGRRIDVVGDAAYATEAWHGLPAR